MIKRTIAALLGRGARALGLAAAGTALFLAGCGDEAEPPAATTLAINPASVSLSYLGETATVSATVTDQRGQPFSAVVKWSSSAPAVFTVDTARGVVTAVSNGTGTLTASAAGLSAQAAVTVQQAADTVVVLAGGGQRGVQGFALRDSVVVLALDRGGAGVAGATVEFLPSAGGAADPASAETDSAGRAATVWTLGDAPGTQSLSARVTDGPASSVDAMALAPADVADSVEILSGASRRAAPGHALAVVVRVVDEDGEAVPGVAVVFAPGEGHGAVTTASAATGEDGWAATEWTPAAESAGPQALRASVEGGPAAAMEATVAAPSAIRAGEHAPEGATGRPVAVSARLVDAAGDPVEGALRFEPAEGHGTVDGGDGAAAEAVVRTDTTATGSVLWTPMGDVAGQPTQMLSVSAPGFPGVPALDIDLRIASGICNRTPQVALAIVVVLFALDPLSESDCADVTLGDLGLPFFRALNLVGLEIASLQPWDFAGIDLLGLDLQDNHLQELPAGIFSEQPNLEILLLGANRLSSSVFAEIGHLRALEFLNLTGNPLGEIPAGAFDEFSALGLLGLEDVGLRAIPPNAFRNLAALHTFGLGLNDELHTLEEDVFQGLSSLKRLDLSNTGIETIEPGAFNGLSALRLLGIGGNSRLTTLPAGAFRGLSGIEGLAIDSTAVATIEPGAFEGLDALEVLYVGHSKLGALPRGAFRGMPRLEELVLDANPELAALPSGAFEGVPPRLRVLGIIGGGLRSIEPGAFDGLAGLEFLVLDNNHLTAWQANAFRGPSALAGLSLGGNKISDLPAAAFAGQSRLRALAVHNNAIAEWPGAALEPLAELGSLDLRGNQLADLPTGALQAFGGSLQHLDLRGNPGAPFSLGLTIERVGADTLSEGDEARLRAQSADDLPVPFAADVQWTASGDVVGVPDGAVPLPAGAVASEPWSLSGDNNGAAGGARVTVAANATFRSDSIFGLELAVADTLAVEFGADSTRTSRRPVAVGSIPDVSFTPAAADAAEAVAVDLAPYFNDPDGDSLVYQATTADAEIAEAAVSGDSLTLVPGSPGTTVVQVRAFDPSGFVAFQDVAVEVQGAFDVEVVYVGEISEAHRAIFEDAAKRWESIFVQGLAPIDFSENPVEADRCLEGQPAFADTVADLRIFAAIRPIDGDRNILAQAGPCALRTDGFLPVYGVMEFDEADIPLLEAEPGGLRGVVLHEMAHVLGLGTIWSAEYANLLRNPSVSNPGVDTHFAGELAIAAFDAAGGTAYTGGAKVPVENDGSLGSADGHWREDVLVTELMTPRYDSGSDALSAITIQSMADIGYKVDASQADAYSLPARSRRALADRRCAAGRCADLSNDIRKGPIVLVGPRGRISGVIRR